MARVLIFNNFLKPGQSSVLACPDSPSHQYDTMSPGRWRANPYSRSKHMSLADAFRRAIASLLCAAKARAYDVVILDSTITGLLVCLYLYLTSRPHIIIWSFNVPRRRAGLAKRLAARLLRRADRIVVHGTYDIAFAAQLYSIPHSRFRFVPFLREPPATQLPANSPWRGRRYIISFGGNARDYASLIEAVRDQPVTLLIVAREYNLAGLTLPPNVKALCNIPLDRCDALVRDASFVVFTLDGSEPSCAQISMVTAFMLAKPVIATRCTGTEDYISDGKNGRFVELGSVPDIRAKIMDLWADSAALSRLSAGAAQWAASYANPEAIQGITDTLVSDLVASSTR